MKWIGLTGGIASGKSTVSHILKRAGYPVVDADELAKFVVAAGSPGLQQVLSHFGQDLISLDGSLDRKKLGRMVFGQPQKLLELEKILHPLIKKETALRKREFERQGQTVAFYDVPLLFEKKLEENFDAIIVVAASEDLQKKRMKMRDQLSDEEIMNRLGSQIPLAEKVRKATWVLHNDGSLEDIEKATLKLVNQIQSGKDKDN